jgi:alanyl-tRNA synthetase
MTAQELRTKYLDFFKSKGHTIIPSASLIPRETDASTLFTTAGMHPLVPYLMGEKHPGGKRVVNVQKCVRTGDIDDVGDNRHLTFFEMMGNWSFGDYFKKEAIEWSFEFLTDKKWLGLDKNRLYFTVFKGEDSIPRDDESIEIWKNVLKEASMEASVAEENEIIKDDVRIIPLGTEDNFWIAGASGPCGGDTEMFYDTRPEDGKLSGKFSDLVNSGRIIEIWNDVFMEFNKKEDGTVEKLKQHNVDTGMGVERTLAVLNGEENVFETELFLSLFEKISELSGKKYADYTKEFRIIADHIKASTFMIAEGATPLNVGRGYVLRRLIRRAVRYGKLLGIENNFTVEIAKIVVEMYKDFYSELEGNKKVIFDELEKEEDKFRKTLISGLSRFKKYISNPEGNFWIKKEGDKSLQSPVYPNDDTAGMMFDLYQTYGFPIEMVFEELKQAGVDLDASKRLKIEEKFSDLLKKHQDLSKTASAGMFKGGLADNSKETIKYHTAAHLMLAALRQVLGEHVTQKGSNITPERLRFDFSHNEKMTDEQKAKVEELVNAAIEARMDVVREEMTLNEARKKNAMGVFDAKYGDTVSVYSIANEKARLVSREICGGPHVQNTGELGHFRIQKEESSSAGVRRIKAILE